MPPPPPGKEPPGGAPKIVSWGSNPGERRPRRGKHKTLVDELASLIADKKRRYLGQKELARNNVTARAAYSMHNPTARGACDTMLKGIDHRPTKAERAEENVMDRKVLFGDLAQTSRRSDGRPLHLEAWSVNMGLGRNGAVQMEAASRKVARVSYAIHRPVPRNPRQGSRTPTPIPSFLLAPVNPFTPDPTPESCTRSPTPRSQAQVVPARPTTAP